MSFLTERAQFEHELDAHYSGYPTDVAALEGELHAAAQVPCGSVAAWGRCWRRCARST